MVQQARIDTAALDRLFDPFDRTNAPGFAVGVALRGVPGYRRGVGMASIELPVALSPTIRMRIGSTSKHFCALAVMLLAEQGRLSIDDSPRRVLPELPGWADGMTIRQLMAHTSGMRDGFDVMLHVAGPGMSAADDMLLRLQFGMDDVNFAPGTNWNYNNAGYVLLTEIVERLSGETFADFLRDRILRPVGMNDTMLRPLDTDLVPNSATLHVPSPDGGWTRGVFGTPVTGMGGIVSTADDMLLWLKHMSSPVVGTAATWAEMRTPAGSHGYGLGLQMDEHRGLRTVHHAGGVVGGCSQMLKVVDHELDLILISNGRSGLDLFQMVDAVIDACITDLPARPVPPAGADADAASGVFHSPGTGRVITLVEHEGRQAVDVGGMILPTARNEDGSLSTEILKSDLRITPVRAADATVALEITEHGIADRLERVEPTADAAAGVQTGAYENAGTGMTATLSIGPEAAMLLLHLACEVGTMDYRLCPIGPNLWQGKADSVLPLMPTLEFDADGFSMTTGRTNRFRFRKA
ncbi:MAG: serine hydrolase domain-containing protein [Janthinobacterium lividum]